MPAPSVGSEIKVRLVSRKTWGLVFGAVFYVVGASNAVVVTSNQEYIAGGLAVASMLMIGLVDAVNAWKK